MHIRVAGELDLNAILGLNRDVQDLHAEQERALTLACRGRGCVCSWCFLLMTVKLDSRALAKGNRTWQHLSKTKKHAIEELCRRFDVEELALFGSAVRNDFATDSDVDFLVAFKGNDYGPFLERLMDFENALADLLERPVDLATRQSIEQSENYIRRNHILSSLRTVYVAR